MPSRPDIVVVLADDMGFSDIGCYGGEVHTPNLDRLAANGTRLSQFYVTPRCSPSRASLMTGLHPHQTGIGILTFDDGPDGYPGNLNDRCVTIPELLGQAGYGTYMSGKWHMAADMSAPNDAWPTRRGFQRFFGTLEGGGSFWQPHTLMDGEERLDQDELPADFYYTDAISDRAVRYVEEHQESRPDDPMFMYVTYTAPHWPLHAPDETIARYKGVFDDGWDALREQRMRRLVDFGVIDPQWPMSDRDPVVGPWHDADEHEWEAHRMAVFAAQIDHIDQGVGRVIDALEAAGRLDNTLIVFLSDNGACAENVEEWVPRFLALNDTTRDGQPVVSGNHPDVFPGPDSTYASYGRAWANLSDTPFREYKHWVHEGGIASPFVVHWPAGLPGRGAVRRQTHQLTDVMATVLDITGVDYPTEFADRSVLPAEGESMLSTLRGEGNGPSDRMLFWEHEGNAAVRRGRWKLVRKYPKSWELYDMDADRTELNDLSAKHPKVARELTAEYEQWAARCGVLPREQVLDLYRRSGNGLPEYY
ncbi:MAG: sulfatase-like hydrolase/transferase [Streptosporangiales bacterium]|nr:sulfatase-like hydrolase/transferase [Streptosporangiales bacterium]